MDVITHPLARMLLGAAILAAGLCVVYLIGYTHSSISTRTGLPLSRRS
jgi:hypothetical protein